jgi:antitoxin component HigA of HigAB toxin-antitoxin module
MRTYTLDELSIKLNWHAQALKVILRKMNIDPDEPIEDEDCAAVAAQLRKAWPVGV